MKRIFLILLAALPIGFSVSQESSPAGTPLRAVSNTAFVKGEYLKYRIHYGIINAGIAELRVSGIETKNGRQAYHMVGTGRSVGMAEWFFKTRDRYETWMDTEALVPWEFIRDVNEGGFEIKRHLIFNQYQHQVHDLEAPKKGLFKTPENVQDLLSTFYYARTLPTEDMEVGDEIPINMFLDHEMFNFKLKYIGKETVKTEFGKVRCRVFRPVVQKGRVFKDEETMTLWVTDDNNKIPVRLKTELVIGSIKMDLVDYKNSAHPIRFQ